MEPSETTEVADRRSRQHRLVLGLALGSVCLFAVSYFLPWWNFDLMAPQYPKGLNLQVGLRGVTGDVSEINILNHYIGMSRLEDAAKLERALAGWLVAGLGLAILAVTLFAGKRMSFLIGLLALVLPVGFVADTMYWLYKFGHDLDPTAPVHIAPFTPTLFGKGQVGQFATVATPTWGFWLAMGGVALAFVAAWRRRKIFRARAAAEEDEDLRDHGLVGTRPWVGSKP